MADIKAKVRVEVGVSGQESVDKLVRGLGGVGAAADRMAYRLNTAAAKIAAGQERAASKAAAAASRQESAIDRAYAKQAMAAERAAAREKASLITVEGEQAKLARMMERRAARTQARANLGIDSSGGLLQGRGFTSRFRQSLGLMRDATAAAYGIYGGFRLATGAVHSILDPFREYSRLMAEASSKQNFTPEQLAAIDAKAKHLGRTTMFSPTQAAEAAVTLAEAGVKGDEIPHTLDPTLKLAQALHMGTGESAHALLQTSTQFGLGINEKSFTHVGDILTKTKTSSTASIEEITDSLKYIGPVANAAGFSLEKTAGMIALLAEGGLKGGHAGSGLSRVLVGLSKPTKAAQKELAHLGLTVKDTQKGLDDPRKFFEMLGQKTEKYSRAQKLALMNTLFGARGQVVALELSNAALRNGGQLWSQLDDRVQHADGSMQKVADTLGETLDGKIKKMDATIETAKLSIAGRLAPAIIKALPSLTDAIGVFGEWTAENLGLVAVFGTAGTAAALAFTAAFGAAAVGAVIAAGIAGGMAGTKINSALSAGHETELEAATGEDNAFGAAGARLADLVSGQSRVRSSRRGMVGGSQLSDEERGAWDAADMRDALNPSRASAPADEVVGEQTKFQGTLDIRISSDGKASVEGLRTSGAPLRVGANVAR